MCLDFEPNALRENYEKQKGVYKMAQTVTMTFDNARNRVRIQKNYAGSVGKTSLHTSTVQHAE